MTGPADWHEPVNSALPAWDLLTGAYAAFMMLAAERSRRETGLGQEVLVPLTDVGIATMANLGQVAEVLAQGHDRPRQGNQVFGTFGRDFVTADGERLMIMAITARQWRGLIGALDLELPVAEFEASIGTSLAEDDGLRFKHRDVLGDMVAGAIKSHGVDQLSQALEANGCCWGRYNSLLQAVADPALVRDNPVFSDVLQPSGDRYPVPGAMATLPQRHRQPAGGAPLLGADSDEVLANVLRLSDSQIRELRNDGVVA